MPGKHGKDTYVSVNATDLSTYTTDSEMKLSTGTAEVGGYGSDDEEYIVGRNSGTFSMSGRYDTTASVSPRPILLAVRAGGVAVEIIRRVEGTGSSLPMDTFDAILTDYTETSPVADKVAWSAEWQITGAIDSTPQSA